MWSAFGVSENASFFSSPALFFVIFSKASSVRGNLPILEQTLWVNFFLVDPLLIFYVEKIADWDSRPLHTYSLIVV